MSNTISALVVSCLKQFAHLISSHHLACSYDRMPLSLWEDELGRLKVWCSNIGAHQTNHLSLDYRLRDASHIKQQLLRLLRRLQRRIKDLQEATNEDLNHEMSSDLEGEGEAETYIKLSYRSLYQTVNCLFQLSVAIRQPAHHDRLLRIKRSDISPYEPWDRNHVMDKFPGIQPVIADRLGSAISQRRAMLHYNERHHMKLAHGLDDVPDGKESTIFSETIVTEFQTLNDVELVSSGSITSYAPSTSQGASSLAIPALPEASEAGHPYECPYCFHIIEIFAPKLWACHIFQDLMAYNCVFQDCPTPRRLYESRHHWFSHLQSEHAPSVDPEKEGTCPLCFTDVPSTTGVGKHVARHLQELALFALPRTNGDDDPNASFSGSWDLAAPEEWSSRRMLASESLQGADSSSPISAVGEPQQGSIGPEIRNDLKGSEDSPKMLTGISDEIRASTYNLEGPWMCEWVGCGARGPFNRMVDLQRHVQTIHNSPRRFPCKVEGCTKIFTRADNRERHVRRSH